MYTYKGENYTLQQLADELKIPREKLFDKLSRSRVHSGDDVTDLLDNYRPRTSCEYVYEGEYYNTSELARKLGISRTGLIAWLKKTNTKDGDDITRDYNHKEGLYMLYGECVNEYHIRLITGLQWSVIKYRLSNCKSMQDVSEIVNGVRVNTSHVEWPNMKTLKRFMNVDYEVTTSVLRDQDYVSRCKAGFAKSARSVKCGQFWIYDCPVCRKKLILTREEWIKHGH